jgi:hypothetical protein
MRRICIREPSQRRKSEYPGFDILSSAQELPS